MLELVMVDSSYKAKVLDFKDEFLSCGEKSIPGSELLDKMDSFDDWINYINKNSDASTVSDDWVLTTVFLALIEENVVGIISLRHELNDFLKDFGHVGYSVRPSMRGRHIATRMLREVIQYAHKLGLNSLQISCLENNIASMKTIRNNNGILVRKINYLNEKLMIYKIPLK